MRVEHTVGSPQFTRAVPNTSMLLCILVLIIPVHPQH